jgi:hypothetical protein
MKAWAVVMCVSNGYKNSSCQCFKHMRWMLFLIDSFQPRLKQAT